MRLIIHVILMFVVPNVSDEWSTSPGLIMSHRLSDEFLLFGVEGVNVNSINNRLVYNFTPT